MPNLFEEFRAVVGVLSAARIPYAICGGNTKTWTGTVILQLVQEGKLTFDDPVSKYRPDVPNGQNITITARYAERPAREHRRRGGPAGACRP